MGALNGMGVPEFDAKAYDQGIREGSTLVIVKTGENEVPRAIEIVRRHRAVQVDPHGAQPVPFPESGS